MRSSVVTSFRALLPKRGAAVGGGRRAGGDGAAMEAGELGEAGEAGGVLCVVTGWRDRLDQLPRPKPLLGPGPAPVFGAGPHRPPPPPPECFEPVAGPDRQFVVMRVPCTSSAGTRRAMIFAFTSSGHAKGRCMCPRASAMAGGSAEAVAAMIDTLVVGLFRSDIVVRRYWPSSGCDPSLLWVSRFTPLLVLRESSNDSGARTVYIA
jgi:hypothetical protein